MRVRPGKCYNNRCQHFGTHPDVTVYIDPLETVAARRRYTHNAVADYRQNEYPETRKKCVFVFFLEILFLIFNSHSSG